MREVYHARPQNNQLPEAQSYQLSSRPRGLRDVHIASSHVPKASLLIVGWKYKCCRAGDSLQGRLGYRPAFCRNSNQGSRLRRSQNVRGVDERKAIVSRVAIRRAKPGGHRDYFPIERAQAGPQSRGGDRGPWKFERRNSHQWESRTSGTV